MSEYLISDELLTSIRKASYDAGKAGKGTFTAKSPSVEVVRCRDCKYCKEIGRRKERFFICAKRPDFVHGTPLNGFCHEAERKEEQ